MALNMQKQRKNLLNFKRIFRCFSFLVSYNIRKVIYVKYKIRYQFSKEFDRHIICQRIMSWILMGATKIFFVAPNILKINYSTVRKASKI